MCNMKLNASFCKVLENKSQNVLIKSNNPKLILKEKNFKKA